MAVDNFIHDGGTFLILVALFGTNVSGKVLKVSSLIIITTAH
jgi:hypothetical protein